MVSVIIPFFNNPDQLKRAISSVNKQTYKTIEILVVDDGSVYDYSSFVNQLKQASPHPIRYFKKENSGPGLSRQMGLDNANGDFIQYLDADDELLPNKLQLQIELLKSNPNVIMTYGLSQLNNNPQKLHRPKLIRKQYDDLLENVLQVRKWHTSACLWRYPKGTYWENLYNGEDVLHDFNVAVNMGTKLIFENSIVANVNHDGDTQSLSQASSDRSKQERFVSDCMTLNKTMYRTLLEKQLLGTSKYANPLAERMFHAAMRVYLVGYRKEAKALAKLSAKTTRSLVKKVEVIILKALFAIPLPNKRRYFQLFYKLRRLYLKPEVHQFRFI